MKKNRTLQSSKLSFRSPLSPSPSQVEEETLSHPSARSHRANHGLRTFHPRWSQLDNVDPKWLDRIWIDPFLWVAPSSVPRRSRPRNQPLPSLQFCGFQRSSRAIIGLPDFRGISVISSPNTLRTEYIFRLCPTPSWSPIPLNGVIYSEPRWYNPAPFLTYSYSFFLAACKLESDYFARGWSSGGGGYDRSKFLEICASWRIMSLILSTREGVLFFFLSWNGISIKLEYKRLVQVCT